MTRACTAFAAVLLMAGGIMTAVAAEKTAAGTFDVAVKPLGDAESGIAAMAMEKTFHGDLTGTGAGRFLALRTEQGSAGYVAIERITGTLDGRQGSFALQHSGTLNRGAPEATISVVPDSGAGGLAGISGGMQIDASGGQHRYTFRYTLPE